MNNAAKRYLSLNCVLHGKSLFSAHTAEELSPAFGCSADALRRIENKLEALGDASFVPDFNPISRVFLNYLRDTSNSFFFVNGNMFRAQDLAISDRRGEVGDEVRDFAVDQFIKDVSLIDDPLLTCITDGVLYTVESNEDVIHCSLLTAYLYFVFGPPNGSVRLRNAESKLRLDSYATLSGPGTLNILKDIVKCGVPAGLYTKTFMRIPCYLETFKRTGCVVDFSMDFPGSINILLDVINSDEDVCSVQVSVADLGQFIHTSWDDLSKLKCSPQGKIVV